jgi:hypothetical protein
MLSIDNYCIYQDSRASKRASEEPVKSHRGATEAHKQEMKERMQEEGKEVVVDETGDPWPEDMWEEVHEPDL